MLVVCERWAGDRNRLLYWPQVLLLTIAALLPQLDLLNHGSLRAQALCLELVLTPLASYLELTPTDSNCLFPGYIIVYVHLLPLFFRLFTQVHLLIDGLVKVQYIIRLPLLIRIACDVGGKRPYISCFVE